MALNFLTGINLVKNELQNAVVQNLASAPSTPAKGQIYYDTVSDHLFTWNGTTWVQNDGLGAAMTGADIVTAINGSASIIDLDNLPTGVGTAVTNNHTHANIVALGNVSGTNTGDNATNTQYSSLVTNATHTGDVTGATALTIADKAVTLVKMADMATASFIGRNTALTGIPEIISVATAKTMLGLGTAAASATGDFATAAQGTLATNAVPKGTVTTLNDFIVGTGAAAVTRKTPTEVVSILSLNNLTNNAQVKKAASSTDGSIPKWSGTSGDAIVDGYIVETTLTGGATAIARADAVKNYIDSLLAASDAMVFKGTLGSGGTITSIPTAYNAGWAYKIITAGTYAGIVCEVGDLIVAIVDRASSGVNADWIVVQTNTDGAVTGPASATDGNFALFDSATGKIIKNSSVNPSSFALAAHAHSTFDRATSVLSGANVFSDVIVLDGIVTGVSTRALSAADVGAAASGHNHALDGLSNVTITTNSDGEILRWNGSAWINNTLAEAGIAVASHNHDSVYPKKYTAAVGGSTSVVITHNLNTKALVCSLARTASPYDIVMTNIELTSVNTVTVKFDVAPSAGEYTITIIG